MGYTWGMINDRLLEQANDYQRIEEAIRFLEENFRQQPDLDEIARSAHLSKYHFQRLFKRWAGISPTQFLQHQGRMAEILKQQAQLFVDAFPDLEWQSPVIFEKSVCPSNDHCADLS